jgi:type IV secretory pathway TrbD component
VVVLPLLSLRAAAGLRCGCGVVLLLLSWMLLRWCARAAPLLLCVR